MPQTLQALEPALQLQPDRYGPLLSSEPYFDLIRGEPSFEEFLTRWDPAAKSVAS